MKSLVRTWIRDSELRRFLDLHDQTNAWVTEATSVSLTTISNSVESRFSFTGGLTEYHWRYLAPHASPLERDVIAKGVLQAILHGRGMPVVLSKYAIDTFAGLDKPCTCICPDCELESTCQAASDRLSQSGGFTRLADDLAERVRNILAAQRQNATRRARGRPRNKETDAFIQERYAALRNASQVAREVATKEGISYDAAYKRVVRTEPYQKMRPAVQQKRPPSKRPLPANMTSISWVARIRTHLAAHYGTTPQEIATALGLPVSAVEGVLWDRRDWFECERGGRWHLIEG